MILTQQEIDNRIEFILDKIAEAIIYNTEITPQLVNQNQKTIRNGIISIGKQNSDRLVLFQKDIKANQEDLNSNNGTHTLTSIVQEIPDISQITISASVLDAIFLSFANGNGGVTEYNITSLLSEISTSEDGTETILNPLNISQFITLQNTATNINVKQANEFLDTNIYELLPDGTERQDRINSAFAEIRDLLPPQITDEQWGLDDDQRIDRINSSNEWVGSEQYYLNNSITAPQDNPDLNTIDEQEAYITRLSNKENDNNTAKSIESLRDELNNYLKDVDEKPVELSDDRPEYENQSNGYLKFRNLNQGIIVRNTNSQYVEGLNPDTEDYLQTGFTISMWVRFLDKTSTGTLFNFGNQTKSENPFGFKLETYVINGDDTPRNSEGFFVDGFDASLNLGSNATWKQIFQNGSGLNWDGNNPTEGFFENTDTERFVRLVVKDGERLRGSHMGMPFMNRRAGLPEFPELSGGYDYYSDGTDGSVPYDHSYGLMTNTRIPTDFNEWYFICATFNPDILEDESHPNTFPLSSNTSNEIYNNFKNYKTFWQNNANHINGNSISNSGYGAKCKVEIISKTDLLRARGYKV